MLQSPMLLREAALPSWPAELDHCSHEEEPDACMPATIMLQTQHAHSHMPILLHHNLMNAALHSAWGAGASCKTYGHCCR